MFFLLTHQQQKKQLQRGHSHSAKVMYLIYTYKKDYQCFYYRGSTREPQIIYIFELRMRVLKKTSALSFTQPFTTHQLHFHSSCSYIFHTGSLGPFKLLFCKRVSLNKVLFSSSGKSLCNQNTAQEN